MSEWSTCALCPRLCRSACPVALGSGREAATPAVIAATLLLVERGSVSAELGALAATLCTDCGACQRHCHLDRPLPELLRAARREALPAPRLEPLLPIEGEGRVVAVESDERPWAEAFARAIGAPVRRWRTRDGLGVAGLHFDGFDRRLARIRDAVSELEVVVAGGDVAEVLGAAGVGFRWLRDCLPELPGGRGSCRREGPRPLACCGGAGPLAAHHPQDAERVGRLWLERAPEWRVVDARCRAHLRRCGAAVEDPVDALLAGALAG